MNHHLDPKKAGLAVGAFVGGWHLLWALLVAIGWAQGLINLVLWMHMINVPTAVNTFDLSVAILLVVVTALVGYAVGYIFALICNYVHRDTTSHLTPMVISDTVSQ